MHTGGTWYEARRLGGATALRYNATSRWCLKDALRIYCVDAIGERRQVLALQAQWCGIMLFRDGTGASQMVTMTMMGWGWMAVRLLGKGIKTASTLGREALSFLIRPIRSQLGRPLYAT